MKNLKAFLLANSGVLGAVLLLSSSAIASEVPAPKATTSQSLSQVDQYASEGFTSASTNSVSLDQVTSVSQLSDVQPTDWAFQALQSLVERYGCIVGYPDGTYRGNRALSRYEFAAGLNACLDRINELIAASTADLATKEDLATLQRLQEEFAAELATLRGRVDSLEARTAFLEGTQFSTTTKLKGEVIFSMNGAFGGDRADGTDRSIDDEITFSDRVRLDFLTSFTGKDLLTARLEAGNIPRLDRATGTPMARLGYDYGSDNDINLTELYYNFPIGDNTKAIIGTSDLSVDDAFFDILNPLASSSAGALSRFGRREPLTLRGEDGAGIAVNHRFSDKVGFNVAYLTDNANDPTQKNGLFNGNYYIGSQLAFDFSDDFSLNLNYAHTYHPGGDINISGSTGSWYAVDPFDGIAASTNNVATELRWKVTPGFILTGWYGVAFVDAQDSGGGVDDGDSATVQDWAVTLAFPDLFKEGSMGGIIFGMPSKVTSNDLAGREDDDTSFHIEALYRFAVNDHISITPGFYVITNPNHDSDNDTIWVGSIRTTFKF